MQAVVDQLLLMPIFEGVDRAQLERVVQHSEVIDEPAATSITHEGRYEGYFFVVLDGAVEITRAGRHIDTVEPGGFFGEVALIDGGPRTATAVSQGACRVLAVANREFTELMDTSPQLRDAVMAAMDERLRVIDAETPA
jgi:CRP-like cAMP-binding protein